jgi:phosphoribosylaminoimidazole (AIR) synthetase
LSSVYAQEHDTVKLKKLFLKGQTFENTIPDSAIYYFEKVITLTKTTPNQTIAGLTYGRFSTLVHDKLGDIKKSFDYNFKALKIFEALHDSANIAQIEVRIFNYRWL